ncbi:MAG: purine nucleoside permease [Puniceicoccales bacterium]
MPVCPKVVLVTMFEPAGRPGELSLFKERLDLTPVELAETGLREVHLGADGDLLALCTGVGTANTAISLTSLGLCPEIDISESFFIIAGIAGADPTAATLGSPVWADWCVDGDLAFEIDAREIPADWPTGILPLGSTRPFGPSDNLPQDDLGSSYQVFEFNHALVQAAYDLSAKLALETSPAHEAYLKKFPEDVAARQAPSVLRGDCLSAARYFHGERATTWAREWVKHWTGGQGRFTTCGMEDSGTLHALKVLGTTGHANPTRALLLRTASNFTQPPPGEPATEHFTDENTFPAFDLALENGNRTATAVIDDILENWPEWNSRF